MYEIADGISHLPLSLISLVQVDIKRYSLVLLLIFWSVGSTSFLCILAVGPYFWGIKSVIH